MRVHSQPLKSMLRRAGRAARIAGAAGLAAGLVVAAAVAMPSMKGHTPAPADSVGTGMPKIGPLPKAPAVPADLSKARKVREFTLAVRHRVFQNFAEQIVARPGDSFPIGDTEFSATVDQYVPDFAMDIKSGRVLSRTAEANNPAVRVVIREKGVVQDTTWALLDSPPHFARKSMLALQLLRIDFTSGKPMVAKQAVASGGKRK